MRISALRTVWPLVRGERIKRRILGDVPGVARRGGGSIFPRQSDEYLSALWLCSAAGARRGTSFRRTCALRHRPGGSVASTERHSRSVSGPHAPLPRARLSSLSLSPFCSRSPDDRSISLRPRELPDQSRGFSARAESSESREITRRIGEIFRTRGSFS